MATWNDVRRLAMSLPQTCERESYGSPAWRVKDKLFVWDRPLSKSDLRKSDLRKSDLRKSDLASLGATAPTGPILAARVADLGDKESLIASNPEVYFTTGHFDDHPSVLIQLDNIEVAELEEIIIDAWLARAPKRLAAQYQDTHIAPER